MTVGVIGSTGWQGAGVSVRLAAAGHSVLMGSRDAAKAQRIASRLAEAVELPAGLFQGVSNEAAAERGEMVFVTLPMIAHLEVLEQLRGLLANKIVVDVTAPVDPANQLQNLWPKEGSATQQAQAALPQAQVVGALKNVSATALMNHRMAPNCDILIVGDDLTAKHRVMSVLRGMGLNSYDVGAGDVCRTVEGLTSMLIYLNYAYHLRQPGVKIAQIDPGLGFIPTDELLQ